MSRKFTVSFRKLLKYFSKVAQMYVLKTDRTSFNYGGYSAGLEMQSCTQDLTNHPSGFICIGALIFDRIIEI